jgi:hypothetical protein
VENLKGIHKDTENEPERELEDVDQPTTPQIEEDPAEVKSNWKEPGPKTDTAASGATRGARGK